MPLVSRPCNCWIKALLRSYCCGSGLFSGAFLMRFQTERFFYQAFDGFGADTLGCFLLKKLHNFSDLSRMLFDILLCLILFFCCKLWRMSTPFFVIESSKMMRFPGIKPMVEGHTINRAYGHECRSRSALGAQYHTMSALSNTRMLTLRIPSMKHAARFWASIVNTSPL